MDWDFRQVQQFFHWSCLSMRRLTEYGIGFPQVQQFLGDVLPVVTDQHLRVVFERHGVCKTNHARITIIFYLAKLLCVFLARSWSIVSIFEDYFFLPKSWSIAPMFEDYVVLPRSLSITPIFEDYDCLFATSWTVAPIF